MLVVQISDLHIAAPGRKTLGQAPMAENLSLCIKRINRLIPRVDLVIITGDITQDGTREEAEHAARLLAQLDAPFTLIPGNHDRRDVLWSVFGGTACPARESGFLSHVTELEGLRLIAMDSQREGAPGGEICATRADWLTARLKEAPDRPTAIFLHHPPTRMGVVESDVDGFVGAKRLGRIIGAHACIQGVFCGHIHLAAHTDWQGTTVSTAPSMGMQLVPDLSLQNPSRYELAVPGFQMLLWQPGGSLVTHTAYASVLEGPFDF